MPVPLFHSLVDKYAVHKNAAIPVKFQTPLGIPILFAAVGAGVLTHPQQLAAPAGSTSGPHLCRSTPSPLCWELMFQALYSAAGASVQEISVRCPSAGRGLPNLGEEQFDVCHREKSKYLSLRKGNVNSSNSKWKKHNKLLPLRRGPRYSLAWRG